MPNLTLDELAAQIQGHFEAKTYTEGLALLKRHAKDFTDDTALITYWALCLTARLGDDAKTNKVLEHALGAGIWYSEEILRDSPSLKPLQGQPEFERLVDISVKMQTADPAGSLPLVVVMDKSRCGVEGRPCPLLLVLHGNNSTAQATVPHWQSAAAEGWLLAVPQSRYAMWADAYGWKDHESAAKEIEGHYQKLSAEYPVDPKLAVLGGYSMGGEMALWIALSGCIEARGFVLLGPGGSILGKPEAWEPLVKKARGSGLRGWIVLGEADKSVPQDGIRSLVEMLNANDIPCELEVRPDLGHDYPPDFSESLLKGLDFIFKK